MRQTNKEPIKLREKKLKNGNVSLYLDCINNGHRSYEFLKLYLIPEKTKWDKERNKTTLIQAEAHKARRIIELQQGKYGVVANGYANRIKLSEYVKQIGEQKTKKLNNKTIFDHYRQAVKVIEEYGDITLQSADKVYFVGLINFLRTKQSKTKGKGLIGESTQKCRLTKISAALNQAVKENLINKNPLLEIDKSEKPQGKDQEREYLTIQEVKAMADTVCKRGSVKRAFLFACFCGLRISDIKALTWADIKTTTQGIKQVEIRQQKTKRKIFVPLSENAIKWLPPRDKRTKDTDKIFKLLPPNSETIQAHLRKWAAAAAVNKKITFHISRHTFATLLLTFGTDIYTVSKLLGHTNINTTAIYAKIIDEKRSQAVNSIPTI